MIQHRRGFSGATFSPKFDEKRLTDQLQVIFGLMKDGAWRTVDEIATAVGFKNTRSVDAQVRNLRKPQFGGYDSKANLDGHMVLRRNRNGVRGLSEYRLMIMTHYRGQTAPAPSLLEAFDKELKRREPQGDLFGGAK